MMSTEIIDEHLLETLWSCAAACEYGAGKMAEAKENSEHTVLLQDCADICTLCARLYARNSVFAKTMIEQCMRACSLCIEAKKKIHTFSYLEESEQECVKCLSACEAFLQG